MWKRIALSYWTTAALGVILLGLHALWLADGGAGGEVVFGFGAALIVLGLFVASRPFIRTGLAATTSTLIFGPPLPSFITEPGAVARLERERAGRLRAAMPDVVAERIVAVAVVMIGTALNGYGAPIARKLGWGA